MIESRVVMVGANPLLRSIGTVVNQPVDESILREAGQQMVDKYAELRAMAETREAINNVSIWDLMDIDKLVDENLISEADMEMVQFSVHIRKLVQGIRALGIEFTNDDFKDLSLITTKLTDIPKSVCIKMYEGLKDIINDPTIDSDLDDILIDSTADLISEKASFENFVVMELGMKLDDLSDEEFQTLQTTKFESYLEWKRTEAERIISEVIKDPMKTVIILPIGFDKVKETMMDVLPVEAAEWVETLTPSSIMTGEVWEHMTKSYGKLGDAQLKRLVTDIDAFLSNNGVMIDAGGQQLPVLFSVNISEILLHTLILASSELFGTEDELSEDTKYVVSLYDYILHSDPELKDRISDNTAYKMLSTIQNMLPLATARSSQIRAVNREYNIATTTITTFITDDIMKTSTENMSEEEKVAVEKSILGK